MQAYTQALKATGLSQSNPLVQRFAAQQLANSNPALAVAPPTPAGPGAASQSTPSPPSVTQPNSTLVQGLVFEPQAPFASQPPTPTVVLSLLGMLAVAVLLAVGAWHQARRGRAISKSVAVKQYTVG